MEAIWLHDCRLLPVACIQCVECADWDFLTAASCSTCSLQNMQAAAELPQAAGPPPFVQTSFGEVLAARVAGAAPRGSPFISAAHVDGEAAAASQLAAWWSGMNSL